MIEYGQLSELAENILKARLVISRLDIQSTDSTAPR